MQYVKFAFTGDDRAAFAGSAEAILCIDHPNYKAEVRIEPGSRDALLEDLTE
ncbi:MAG: DUF3501 family protein [Candidatus Binatia bacterium]